ncbi:MAG: hypothetical protein ACXQS4_03315 [Methermicoccaceae archaeon]
MAEEQIVVKCAVVDIKESKEWRGVVMEELKTKSRVYFPRFPREHAVEKGDIFEVRMEKLPPELLEIDERVMKVSLLDDEGNVLDWTML